MTEINLKREVYLYGKPVDKYETEANPQNFITIYIKPTIFDNVSLSSLEGIFVIDDAHLERTERISWQVPRLRIKRENMEAYEKKHHGEFIPFEK